jgi:Ice-binding-like/Bacterial Ig-like domain
MRNLQLNKMWSRSLGIALLLGFFMFLAGCGREQASSKAQNSPAIVVAPRVSSTNPPNLFDCEPINRKITAAFTKAMNPLTINTATFLVTGINPVTGTVVWDATNNIALFKPSSNLAPDAIYTATITTSAQDTSGNPLASNFSWSFESCLIADATAPTVSSTVPANTAAAVPINGKITATFSEGMDSTTLTATTFLLTGPGTTPVTGTVTYAGNAGAIATFTPASNLAPSTLYTAKITAGAMDLAGNALAGGGVAPNPWTFTTGTAADLAPPTITSTVPANIATGVGINQAVNATFSKAMDPTTISTATFTVTGPGATPVTGTVAYDVPSHVATLTPTTNLAPSTTYTATISGVKDVAGNALATGAAPNPWTFTTGTATTGQAPVNLRSASTFAVIATSSISSTGSVQVNGDVGLHPGTSQGIPPAQVNGTIHVNDPQVVQAQADLLAAYNDAVSRSTNSQTLPGNLGGLTFAPGLYTNSTSVLISGAGPGNNVTLDAGGDANGVFIFKMGSTLTTGPGSQVILAGGAQAKNVFWQVGTSATIDTTTAFEGNILAAVSITLNTGAVVQGRMFAGSAGGAASVTVNAASITVPAP